MFLRYVDGSGDLGIVGGVFIRRLGFFRGGKGRYGLLVVFFVWFGFRIFVLGRKVRKRSVWFFRGF